MASLLVNIKPWPEEILSHYKWLSEYMLSQAGTEMEFKTAWQAERFLLRGKMYAYIGVNDGNGRPILTVKLEPAYSDMLRREYADIEPGYYMNKLYWSSIYLDGQVSKAVLVDAMTAAYNCVFSSLTKKAQRELAQA